MSETTTKDLNVTEIDEISAPPPEPEKPTTQPDVPGHLVRHECGLWMIFVTDMSIEDEDGGLTHYKAKKEIVRYLQDHTVTNTERSNLQVTDTERQLYNVYTAIQRRDRVTKDHFVSALRLCHHGFELWPNKTKNLNDMKVL